MFLCQFELRVHEQYVIKDNFLFSFLLSCLPKHQVLNVLLGWKIIISKLSRIDRRERDVTCHVAFTSKTYIQGRHLL
jgi:hypothetical protein